MYYLPLTLSCIPLLICGVNFYVCGRFSTPFFLKSFFGVGLPAYLSNHNPFSREHIFEGFNEFLLHGCSLFRRVRWDLVCVQCNVCTDMGPPQAPVLSPI